MSQPYSAYIYFPRFIGLLFFFSPSIFRKELLSMYNIWREKSLLFMDAFRVSLASQSQQIAALEWALKERATGQLCSVFEFHHSVKLQRARVILFIAVVLVTSTVEISLERNSKYYRMNAIFLVNFLSPREEVGLNRKIMENKRNWIMTLLSSHVFGSAKWSENCYVNGWVVTICKHKEEYVFMDIPYLLFK